jgi:N-acetylglucosamine-6-phosphate deacetylase
LQIYSANKLFTGSCFLTDHAIVSDNGIISKIVPVSEVRHVNRHAHYIIPSFVDVQIYGAHDKLFSVYPSVKTLQLMYEHCRKGGTSHFLPTVATNTHEVMYRCMDAVKEYWEQGGLSVMGLHLEGPWINPARRGAHIEAFIRKPLLAEVKEVLEYGKEVIKMITIAPELCTKEVIDLMLSYKIIISAGHSNATFEEANSGFNNDITAVTHLFNAMSPFHHRDIGLPGAAFHHPTVKASIIADGHHISYPAIKTAWKIMGERLFLITDAVTSTDEGPYQHKLEGDKYTSAGILSGSALTMLQAVKNCIQFCGIDVEDALRMGSLIPARLINIEAGELLGGRPAHFKMLDEEMNIITD